MSKIEIKNLFLVFGHEKQKALRLLSEGVGKDEILKKTGCTVAVNNANLQIAEGDPPAVYQPVDKAHIGAGGH